MSNRETIKIGSPLSSFGSVLVAEKTPIVQLVATYGITDRVDTDTTSSGSVGKDDGGFFVSSGTTIGARAAIQSHRHASYHAGQGVESPFTAYFTTGVANSIQFAGMYTATDGVGFGYDGTSFGVLHRHGGITEVQTLTLTVAASGAENATVTIDGTGYTVALTGGGTLQDDAHEIAVSLNSQVTLWDFSQNDDTVVCLANVAEIKSGAFTHSSATSTGTFAETSTGALPTEDWTAQANWNVKTLLTGDDAIDPTKGNVYKVDYQYLGYGFIVFWVETISAKEFEIVHIVEYPNSHTMYNFANPTMHVGWFVESDTSTTNLTVHGASAAIFIHGKVSTLGNTRARSVTKAVASADGEQNLLTIRARRVFGDVENKAELVPYLLTLSNEGNKSAIFRLRRNATFIDNTNYQFVDSMNSIAEIDESANDVTSANGELLSFGIAAGASEIVNLRLGVDVFLAHDDTLTISAEHGGTSSDMVATLSWKENF